MSIPTTAERVLSVAKGELGTHESPAGSNRQKYGVWANLNGVAWCGIFVTWVFAHAGYDWSDKFKGWAYTPRLEAELRKLGFVKVDASRAKPGDVVFYNFPDSVDRIQHVGIVKSSGKGELIAIEGNTSAASDANGGIVQERERPYRFTFSVLRPPYEVPKPRTTIKRVLKARRFIPIRGDDVKAVQRLVGATADGVYGPLTKEAVKRWQKSKRIAVDGEFGRQSTWAAGWVWAG